MPRKKSTPHGLAPREKQIMDVLFHLGRASVSEVREQLADPPSYSAVRALIKKLLDKGHVSHRQAGSKYIYAPVLPKNDAKKSAVQRLVNTFFDGSPASAVVNLLGSQSKDLSADDIQAIEAELAKLKGK